MTMTPSEGRSSGYDASVDPYIGEFTQAGSGISPYATVSTKDDAASIQSTVDEMEAKILERVSQLTISTALPEGEGEASEVSFTMDDLSNEAARATCSAGAAEHESTLADSTLAPSPIRPRSKRTSFCLTTPIANTAFTFETPQISNTRLGPRRKKRRPGTLVDAPRLPSSPFSVSQNPPFSPLHFQPTIYDERLERLASQMQQRKLTIDNIVPSLETSCGTSPNIIFEPNFFESTTEKRNKRRPRRGRRGTPILPCLSPKQSIFIGQQLTPLESLAISIEASPIMPTLSRYGGT
jgi:hypothetical protein